MNISKLFMKQTLLSFLAGGNLRDTSGGRDATENFHDRKGTSTLAESPSSLEVFSYLSNLDARLVPPLGFGFPFNVFTDRTKPGVFWRTRGNRV